MPSTAFLLLKISDLSLTDLRLCNVHEQDISNVNESLEMCLRLKSLRLGFRKLSPFAAYPVLSRMVHLSTLTLLHVRIASPESCAAFGHLSALQTLTLCQCLIQHPRDWRDFGSALHKTPLKSLRLMSIKCDVEKMSCLLESLTLDHLVMSSGGIRPTCSLHPRSKRARAERRLFKTFVRFFTKSKTNLRSFLLVNSSTFGKNLNGVVCKKSLPDLQ